MSSLELACLTGACLLGGLIGGLGLARFIPHDHLSNDSKDTVKIASGMIATLAALVLGLLVASAKANFDTSNNEIVQSSVKIIALDQVLRRYGPEAQPARDALKASVTKGIQRFWPEEAPPGQSGVDVLDSMNGMEQLANLLGDLQPQTDAQRARLKQALQMTSDMQQARWLLVEQSQNRLPAPFFAMLILWLTVVFLGLGLFAPRNPVVLTALLLCIVSFACALFMISELNHPLDGVIKVSKGPMLKALEHLEK